MSTTPPPLTGEDAVRLVLAGLGLQRISMATLTATVLEENPHLTITQVYAGLGAEARAGRAELRVTAGSGIVYVQRRTADVGENLTDWILANDAALSRLVDRVEEDLDDALIAAGAGKLAVKVLASLRSRLVADLSRALEYERGAAVESYVRESGTHPSDVRRRRRAGAGPAPRLTNPPAASRFSQ